MASGTSKRSCKESKNQVENAWQVEKPTLEAVAGQSKTGEKPGNF